MGPPVGRARKEVLVLLNETKSDSRKQQNPLDFELGKDLFVSELLCDNCKFGMQGRCEADPPCATYKYLEEKFL